MSELKKKVIDPNTLSKIVISALQDEAFKYVNFNENTINIREYVCSVDKCARKAYAKGLCNAHYIRERKGLPMDAPVRNRTKNSYCIECGKKTTSKGGFGRCSKHYKNRRRWIIKEALIKVFGGKCQRCEKSFNQYVYDFHHISKDDKKHSIAMIIVNGSFSEIGRELSKCILLCANCHREVHNEQS